MKLIIIGLLPFFITACAKKIDWAQECANRFPSQSDTVRIRTISEHSDTVYKAGEVLTIRVPCPPIAKQDSNDDGTMDDTMFIIRKVVCPPCREVVRTLTVHDSTLVTVENRAQIALYERTNALLTAQTQKQQARIKTLYIILALLLIVLLLFGLFYKNIKIY